MTGNRITGLPADNSVFFLSDKKAGLLWRHGMHDNNTLIPTNNTTTLRQCCCSSAMMAGGVAQRATSTPFRISSRKWQVESHNVRHQHRFASAAEKVVERIKRSRARGSASPSQQKPKRVAPARLLLTGFYYFYRRLMRRCRFFFPWPPLRPLLRSARNKLVWQS